MWQGLHDNWWRLATQSHPRSFLDFLACRVLQTSSVAYRAWVTLRNTAYDRGWARQVRLPCRVVSVGNLTIGGTGKTTCVELIARKLRAGGRRVAVLSRGYGGARRDYWLRWEGGRFAVNGQAAMPDDGLADEPQLLARRLEGMPVVVDAKRSRGGRLACELFQAEAVILDDGFQHRRLRRDCDIVLVRARMPFGGLAMLPRGPMREPFESIRRAHVVIMTNADEALDSIPSFRDRLQQLNPGAALVVARHEPEDLLEGLSGAGVDLAQLHGRRIGLLSSIGDPGGFETTVRSLHAEVAWHQRFPDHHRYRAADLTAIHAQVKADRVDAVVTTEKDWVRLEPLIVAADRTPAVPIWVVRVRLKLVSGEEALDDRLARLFIR